MQVGTLLPKADPSKVLAIDPADVLLDFLEPSRRAEATRRLAARGAAALPAIASALDGSARNRFGVSLRSTSAEVVRCALVAARQLGPVAASLEPLLCAELRSDHASLRVEAAQAVANLGSVSEPTLGALAALLEGGVDGGYEAAAAIVRLGLDEHALVLRLVDAEPRARLLLNAARERAAPPPRVGAE